MLSQKRLHELLNYDQGTGIWRWKIRQGRSGAGTIAGNKSIKGYIQVQVEGKNYTAHRLAFLYVTGKWPRKQVDHINLDRSDCSWNNLREATSSQNGANRRVRSDKQNRLPKGVYPNGSGFCARIQINEERKYLGQFKNIEDAQQAYERAALVYFGSYMRLH